MVEYKLDITPEFFKQLRNIPQKYHHAIKEAVEEIKEASEVGKPLQRDMIGRSAWHASVYRIIYKVYEKDKRILVLTVKHRGVAYD